MEHEKYSKWMDKTRKDLDVELMELHASAKLKTLEVKYLKQENENWKFLIEALREKDKQLTNMDLTMNSMYKLNMILVEELRENKTHYLRINEALLEQNRLKTMEVTKLTRLCMSQRSAANKTSFDVLDDK